MDYESNTFSVESGDHLLSRRRSLRKQFLPNLIANGGIFVLNTLLGMWYTPYLIRHLGVAT